MKRGNLTKYGLIGACLLLAGVMLLPDRAMAPPPLEPERLPGEPGPIPEKELKEIKKPRTKIAFVRISGTVTVSRGRKLKGVRIFLFEIQGHRVSLVKETKTNSAGFYSFGLGETWLGKRVRVEPLYVHSRDFTPHLYQVQITGANMAGRDFRYTGPLPDLKPLTGPAYSGFRFRDGMCIYYFGVKNESSEIELPSDAGPFKVRVRYDDHTGGIDNIYKIKSVTSSIAPGAYETVEVELGPGTAEDQKVGGYVSGSGRYRMDSIRVDLGDAVVESNEDNNHLVWS